MKSNFDEDDESDSGDSGKSGRIRYKDPLTGPLREDALQGADLKKFLAKHNEHHQNLVKKQKQTRKDRETLKNASEDQKNQKARYGSQGGFGKSSAFKSHPILRDKAQFHNMDPKITFDPNANNANTNEDQRKELQNELQNRLRYQAQPKFNPKPRPF